MKRTFMCWGAMLALVVLIGCNSLDRQPRLAEAAIVPATLSPGDTAIVTVTVTNDHFGIVDRVRAVVLEDPRMKFDLRDDGTAPDLEAGDGIWTMQVDVPDKAPAGDFVLQFTATTADGNPIPVRGAEGSEAPLSVTHAFSIQVVGSEEQPKAG